MTSPLPAIPRAQRYSRVVVKPQKFSPIGFGWAPDPPAIRRSSLFAHRANARSSMLRTGCSRREALWPRALRRS